VLFNSYEYLLAFLPLALILFHGLRRLKLQRLPIAAAVLLSLAFYAWWEPLNLLLLVPLIGINFELARRIAPRRGRPARFGKPLLALGITLDLATLAWFKYANFGVDTFNALAGTHVELARIVLPIGISFFVFQMIASLVDAWRGHMEHFNLLDYALFITFFPQLVAGPIVHHGEMLPQFHHYRGVTASTVALGVTILAIGLAKKVLLADSVAGYASARFDAAAAGQPLAPVDAWAGALAYTAQLYFDFSGYSDMAIGAGLLFGIRLPVNFASPYKAESIIDFWRRWHMTLSRFLRDYLYVPLGGGRRGPVRRHVNLLLTMLLGGLWHGAGWTFVAWGAMHGLFLVANHAWRALAGRHGIDLSRHAPGRWAAWAVTFLAVVVAWVFFRAADLPTAGRVVAAMAGLVGMAGAGAAAHFGDNIEALLVAAALLALARLAPNTQELAGYAGPGEAPPAADAPLARALRWRPSPVWAVATGAGLAVALMSLSRVSEFLYFQF